MAQKGFLLHVTLRCVGVVIMVEWKTPERGSEEEESRAADGELLVQCRVLAAMSFINKVEALWWFGGVSNSLAGNHRGRTSVHTVSSTHIILPHFLVLCRSSGLQQASLRGVQSSLNEVWTHIWVMHVFSVRWCTLWDDRFRSAGIWIRPLQTIYWINNSPIRLFYIYIHLYITFLSWIYRKWPISLYIAALCDCSSRHL